MGITGHFKVFVMILTIIFIHECGHILMAYILRWKIVKVNILPLGAVTIFDVDINKPIWEEFLIALMGPLVQIVFTCFVFPPDMRIYSMMILGFNLLPIFPLDGSKFLNLFLNKITSFRNSLIFTLDISFLFLALIIFKSNFNLILILVISFILGKIIVEYRSRNEIFNRFLLERFTKRYRFSRLKIIRGMDTKKMKRDFRHIFKDKKRCFSEREILLKRFDFKGKL